MASSTATTTPNKHIAVLDGWRAISILLVLAAHLLPLGPGSWGLNGAAELLGMSLFFCLSGFLITTNLACNPSIRDFVVRRLARILPLAYLAIAIGFTVFHASGETYLVYLLFIENYLHSYSVHYASHFWSLCVEVHFYAAIARAS